MLFTGKLLLVGGREILRIRRNTFWGEKPWSCPHWHSTLPSAKPEELAHLVRVRELHLPADRRARGSDQCAGGLADPLLPDGAKPQTFSFPCIRAEISLHKHFENRVPCIRFRVPCNFRRF